MVSRRVRDGDANHLLASPRLAIATPSQYRFWNGPEDPQPERWVEPPGDRLAATARPSATARLICSATTAPRVSILSRSTATPALPTFARPWFTDGVHKIQRESGLPTIISEFGIRARIPGWSNRGGAGAFVPSADAIDDQIQRGQRYRSQLEQFIGFRHMVGAVWHAWSDRYIPDDTSLQINLGLVQCTDTRRGMNAGRRWDGPDRLIAETNRSILQRIAANTGF